MWLKKQKRTLELSWLPPIYAVPPPTGDTAHGDEISDGGAAPRIVLASPQHRCIESDATTRGEARVDGNNNDCTPIGGSTRSRQSGVLVISDINVPDYNPIKSRTVTFHRNLIRGAFTTLSMMLDYGLMLVTMSFNAGLFLVIIFGFGLGAFLFSEMQPTTASQRERSDTKDPRGTATFPCYVKDTSIQCGCQP
eukprot:TRINITY_DN2822_c0_g2_i2.p1 TRINITY_DN2822_c0_g2~~TRINITY_DN2822_c0_g2_i2.p1  ORF type:complete len:194 (-),score=4.00 TRINITY_DN2822_c0_g2_i2:105-686(-)